MNWTRWQVLRWACAVGCGLFHGSAALADSQAMARVDAQIAGNVGKTGIYVLETGEEALLARAWLVDQAREAIEVQYFIWSIDNIGILAAEALLRAADRGVNQRMHDKTLVVDGKIAITGGRNMAAEYFDYNHEYDCRDRDAQLLLGEAAKAQNYHLAGNTYDKLDYGRMAKVVQAAYAVTQHY